jgi:hypothetical protein
MIANDLAETCGSRIRTPNAKTPYKQGLFAHPVLLTWPPIVDQTAFGNEPGRRILFSSSTCSGSGELPSCFASPSSASVVNEGLCGQSQATNARQESCLA